MEEGAGEFLQAEGKQRGPGERVTGGVHVPKKRLVEPQAEGCSDCSPGMAAAVGVWVSRFSFPGSGGSITTGQGGPGWLDGHRQVARATRSVTAASVELTHGSRCGQQAVLGASQNIWRYRGYLPCF